MRATRHPHVPHTWCYRQGDKAYEHLKVGSLDFSQSGGAVCAIADIVDVKPPEILEFLEDEGYVTPCSGLVSEGLVAAIEHFGGSVFPAGTTGLQAVVGAEDLEALRDHLAQDMPAIVCLRDASGWDAVVAAAGYDAEREEVLLFDPRGPERDGWYAWDWLAAEAQAFLLAATPEDNRYSPRSVFKRIYGIDIAGHEQRWPDIDLAALQKINPACIGWIHLGGTPLSYPIVKERADTNFYVNHNFSGEPSIHGAVTLSFNNGGAFGARNLVFSAHRMRDYSMFKMLTFYDRPDFFVEKPCIDLLLGNKLYQARVFSAYNFLKKAPDSAYAQVNFDNVDEFHQWVQQRVALSMHPFPSLENIEQVATFRTCYGMENDQMFAVHASLEFVRDVEEQ